MHIASSIEEMRAYRAANSELSFVPTMGALHVGHMSLIKQAKETNNKLVTSIFVNPTQFSAGEDLDKYPRQLEADLALLREAGVDCVFTPTLAQMYPTPPLCHVEPARFSAISEGLARPDFFRGVATIVCKLFNIVQPRIAYFGQKDIGQCVLVRRMVTDLNMDVKVRICETVREADGLALSSRNAYLAPHERAAASVLHRALSAARQLCLDSNGGAGGKGVGAHGATREQIIAAARAVLAQEPLITGVEYVSLASHEDMTELEGPCITGAVISSAVRVGQVRLIDNLLVGAAHSDILG
jgi:pantoate--beta-alanine ligase